MSWTVDTAPGLAHVFQYAFRLTDAGGALIANRAYSSNSVFGWIPMADGFYTLTTDIKDLTTGATEEQQSRFTVVSDADSSAQPRIFATRHPLVASYSISCDAGQVRVFYYPASGSIGDARVTPAKQCLPGKRIAFIIGGMRPTTDYVLQSQVVSGGNVRTSSTARFTTGSLPADLQVPAMTIESPQTAGSSAYENVVLESFIGRYQNPVAYDNQGNVLWYYWDPYMPQTLLYRPVPGGTILFSPSDETSLREIDLAGNVLHEITAQEASQQVAPLGLPAVVNFNHDAVRLPNGNTATLAAIAQLADQGSGSELVIADMVVVLDRDWKIVWTWNPFQKLNISRRATLEDKSCVGFPYCGAHSQWGNDWTHANSLQYLPDGNFLVSVRSQDWLIKIDYRDGMGTGDVLWRLGSGGDFTTDSSDPYPWFSHQHFATLINGELTVFDNGNTRVAQTGSGNSRGQVWKIDESSLTAHLVLNADLGTYSFAVGSAQRLGNGNYQFLSGIFLDSTGWRSEATEVVPNPLPGGTASFKWGAPSQMYRVFRMTDLYCPENVQ